MPRSSSTFLCSNAGVVKSVGKVLSTFAQQRNQGIKIGDDISNYNESSAVQPSNTFLCNCFRHGKVGRKSPLSVKEVLRLQNDDGSWDIDSQLAYFVSIPEQSMRNHLGMLLEGYTFESDLKGVHAVPPIGFSLSEIDGH